MSLVTIPTMRKPAGVRALVQFIFAGESSLDPRITFSRTSNATITKSDGTIGYAPHNLLTHSEQFDNSAWTKTTTTVTANAIASPTGTTTGDTLTASGANSTTLHSYTAIAQPYTFSIYIRRRTGTGTIEITADGSTYVAKTITSDWQRFDTTITPTAGTRTTGVRIVTSGDAIDVWGAQLEIGSTATTYNPTTVKNILGFTEAFDNAAWTKSNSFVQTNLATYSEDFSNALWVKTTTTVATNTEIAPNGYQTADTLTATGSNSTILDSFTASAVPYTFSVWLKRKTGTGNIDITVDGTTYVTKTITTEWTRVDTTLTPSAGTRTCGIRIATNGDEVFAWGAQLVQGSVAGDYRRTDAAALPVFYPNHNGVVCAEKLVENTAASTNHQIFQNFTAPTASVPYTFSIYAKAAERSNLTMLHSNGFTVNYNLSTGTASGTGASIISVGNGWYRCSVIRNVPDTATRSWVILLNNGSSASYTGDGTSGIYIFGAQLSDSASLDPYVLNAGAAPSAAAYYGPRFNYDPVTLAAKGLLIGEQRSNLLLNSSLAGTSLATQNVTVTAVAHTLSFYGTGTVTLSGTATATVNGTGAYPTRTTLTFTPTAGTLTVTVSGTVQYAQLEIGSLATSFIPTAASAVTRTADVATIAGSNFWSWWNRLEGAMVAQFDSPASGNRNIIGVDDNTANNRYQLRTEGTDPYFRQRWVNTEQVALDLGTVSANTISKIAYSYKVDDFGAVFNGGTVQTDTSASTVLVDRLRLGTSQAGEYLNGHIKQMSYYNIALSDAIKKDLTA